jgi:uncharacterized protein
MITGLYAALLAIMFIALTVNVVVSRRSAGVALGDNGPHSMLRRVRAHGNFTESAPLFIILMALAEMQGMHTMAVHGHGALFVLGRVLHAYSLLSHERYEDGVLKHFPKFRVAGMMCTFSVIGSLAAMLVWQYAQFSFAVY